MNIHITVDSVRFDSIAGLPAGIFWNSSPRTLLGGGYGCISLAGVTNAPAGTYNLTAFGTAWMRMDAPQSGIVDTPYVRTGNLNQYSPFGEYYLTICDYGVQLPANQTVCSGSNVTLSPIATGGQPPYTFSWTGTGNHLSCTTCKNPQVTLTQNSTYNLTMIDANNNQVNTSITYTVSGSNTMGTLAVNSTGIDCLNPQDNTTVAVTGGTGPFVFNWGDGTSSSGNSPQNHNYSTAETFVISVKDNNNCVTSAINDVVFNGIIISAAQTTQPTCEGQNTGTIAVTATGGTAPYTFAWSNGANNATATNIAAGNHTVTVTDATSCSFSKHFNLAPQNGWGFFAFLQPSQSNCNNTGAITTTVVSGIAPYTFLWNTTATTQNLSSLSGAVYSVTVTDALGCQTNGSTNVPVDCKSVISGTLFNDANNNCVFDNGETNSSGIVITAVGNSQTYFGYAFSDGTYSIDVPAAGSYTLSAYNYWYANGCGYYTLCGSNNQTITIATLGEISANNNFGLGNSSGYNLTIFPRWTAGNPGFEKTYTINVANYSPTVLNSPATVTFTYDSNLIYQSSVPTASHNLETRTLTWLVDSLNTYYIFASNSMLSTFLVPQNLSLGYLLQSDFHVSPTSGDCNTSDNSLHTSDVVTGSYDPNEKKVEPTGNILEEDSVLTYEIGFQNTGTDSTHFIILKDTLSPYLDPATVRNIASSHPYSDFSISGTGILTWTFNPLRLVDSFTNEPGSHGFVKFTIKKKKNLPLNTVISNTAHIYFDYNPAVVTNTVANTLTEPNGIWHIRSTEGITVKAFPNPFSEGTSIVVEGITGRYDFELYDVTGKLNKRITSIETSQFFINRDNLSSGIYFFKVLSADKKKSGYGKLVVE
ncbi:MAG TPA: T9SS type A sorting domain-containing protein [Chitinophagales bacterium]|nr:T9SS type A sorting domain-containing protein [Chitinophagales bacterium]